MPKKLIGAKPICQIKSQLLQITHVQITETTVYLLSIYDKSEQSSISDVELKELISQIIL